MYYEHPAGKSSYVAFHNLIDLEEVYDNMNYKEAIDKYSHFLPFSASVTRFRYCVIFSALDENLTYDIIDKNIRQTIDAKRIRHKNKPLTERFTIQR